MPPVTCRSSVEVQVNQKWPSFAGATWAAEHNRQASERIEGFMQSATRRAALRRTASGESQPAPSASYRADPMFRLARVLQAACLDLPGCTDGAICALLEARDATAPRCALERRIDPDARSAHRREARGLVGTGRRIGGVPPGGRTGGPASAGLTMAPG